LISHHRPPPLWLGVLVAVAFVALMAGVRLGLVPNAVLPIGYGVPIVFIAYFRNRTLLWSAFAAFTVITIIKFFASSTSAVDMMPLSRFPASAMVELDLLLVATMGHLWMLLQDAADARTAELERANKELAEREGEISRKNDALQSQAVELEAQSEELRLTSEQREAVLRTAPLGLVIANADATDVRVNPTGAALFGVSADKNVAHELGRGNWRLFRDGRELSPQNFPVVQAVRQGVEIQGEEFELRSIDGRRQALLVNSRSIRGEAGKIIGGVVALADITPQKSLQREIELRRREAEEANLRKTQFLAAVSHDVRTPANAIGLLADLLRRTAADPARAGEILEITQELHASAVLLVSLLNDVLDIARFDSGGMEIRLSEFSLGEMMEKERGLLIPLAREKTLAYQWVLPPEEIWLRTDRLKLSRVLGNLVGNALKFTDRGEVRVEAVRTAAGGADIRVIDTGIGIPAEHQRHIFDEFFQLRNPERDHNKGSGLGLSICKRLADAMGASLSVQSAAGQGSVFTVSLPPSAVIERPARTAGGGQDGRVC
jgi:PAS domain S-box-containing protein